MKNFFFGLILVWASLVGAAYKITWTSGGFPTIIVSDLNCGSVKQVIDSLYAGQGLGYVVGSCTSNPVFVGTVIQLWPLDGGGNREITGIVPFTPSCDTGSEFDYSSQNCISLRRECLPSVRTIAPCPSGFAPTNAIPIGSGSPDPYLSKFDSMAVQDLLYALGVALFGVLGLGIGVKLT